MKSVCITFFSIVVVIVWGASVSQAAIRTVSNSSELQSALNAAVAGDEIVLKDGVYTGQFIINGNSGTTSFPITVRAENKHGAVLSRINTCNGITPGLYITHSYWSIKDLRFRNQ